ncbi:tRNA delta(2)-isopentenylpyrophosphate transferase [Pseudothermotoga thermarum DSM 5069]|uniref:tRNA dimethylallyltransferase n=1 Tax=Pseudothermotoga thermarum DSM 5069 TaxID=688269 RepID=F7YXR4_9THEM|nr:tRNA delta(2)-isopentenylpyrophosphate transferase [Pseudothermotoga thermarum DSM 5069]
MIITGPTGVGKTELVIEAFQGLNVEIVSVDSRQIYRYMDIGTAKPTKEQQSLIKHHLIDIVDPDEYFSAYDFRQMAINVIKDILNRGKIPLLVGGTGLYIDTLVRGIFDGVPKDEQLRQKLLEEEKSRPGSLREQLLKIDHVSAAKIHPNDLKRTIRALEVWYKTRIPLSEHQRTAKPVGDFKIIVLNRDRKELYDRINRRVEKMIELGLVDEVKNLLERGYTKDLNSMKTIGYQEVIEYLEGKADFETTVEKIKKNSRNFARRQLIWFRRYKDAVWLDCSCQSIVKKIQEIVLNDAKHISFF